MTNLEEKKRPNTPPEVVESRRDAATHAAKIIEEEKQTCAKVVDQVSQTWEALIDNEKSQRIASELTTFEANITQIKSEMKHVTYPNFVK